MWKVSDGGFYLLQRLKQPHRRFWVALDAFEFRGVYAGLFGRFRMALAPGRDLVTLEEFGKYLDSSGFVSESSRVFLGRRHKHIKKSFLEATVFVQHHLLGRFGHDLSTSLGNHNKNPKP